MAASLVVIITTLSILSCSLCATLYVNPQTGVDAGDCSNVQNPCKSLRYSLLTQATHGSTIQLASGVYKGIENTRLELKNMTLGGIVIQGDTNGETIFDGESINFFMHLDTCESGSYFRTKVFTPIIAFSHVTFRNFTISETTGVDRSIYRVSKEKSAVVFPGGSVIFAREGCNIALTDCTVEDSDVKEFVGINTVRGILYFVESMVEMTRVTVRRCRAVVSSGKGEGALFLQYANAKVTNCTFEENEATNLGNIRCIDYVHLELSKSRFLNNFFKRGAGVAFAFLEPNTSVINIDSNEFIDNEASIKGGALYGRHTDYITVKITNNIFINNKAPLGGAISFQDEVTRAEIEGCEFYGNTASNGGAFSSEQIDIVVEFKDCIFNGNSASVHGGAIFNLHAEVDELPDKTLNILDSTFANNTAQAGGAIYAITGNVSGCSFKGNNELAIFARDDIYVSNSQFADSLPYDIEGIIHDESGNDIQSIKVSEGDWLVDKTMTVANLNIEGASVTLVEGAQILVEKKLTLEGTTMLGTYQQDDSSKRDDDALPSIVLTKNSTVAEISLGTVLLTNILLENRGTLSITSHSNLVFEPKNTTIVNKGGSILNVGKNIILLGEHSTIRMEPNSSFDALGSMVVSLSLEFEKESEFLFRIGENIEFKKAPKLGGIFKLTTSTNLPTPKINDAFRVFTFSGNESRPVTTFDAIEATFEATTRFDNEGMVLVVIEKVRTLKERYWDDIATVIMIALAAFGVIVVFGFEIFVFAYWSAAIVHASTKQFLIVILNGCLLSYIGVVVWAAPESDLICELRVWAPLVGFVFVFSPLVSKTYRIHKIFNKINLQVYVISLKMLIKIMLAIVFGQIALLIVWSATSPNRHAVVTAKNNDDYQENACASKNGTIFLVLFIIYDGCILIAGAYLAFCVRQVPTMYNESKWIGLTIYNLLVWAILVLVLGFSINNNGDNHTVSIVVSICIWVNTTVTIAVLFVPKVWSVVMHPEDMDRQFGTYGSSKSKSTKVDEICAKNSMLEKKVKELQKKLDSYNSKIEMTTLITNTNDDKSLAVAEL